MKSLRELKGVGEKTEKLLAKAGLRTTGDLLRYYPRRYEMYEEPVLIRNLREGEVCTIHAQVITNPVINTKSRIPVTTVTVRDTDGKLNLIWFRAPYIRSIVKKGSVFFFRGRISRRGKNLQMDQPEVFSPLQYADLQSSLQPVYALTAGLSNKTVQKLVRQVMEETGPEPDFLPEEIRERYQLAEENFAVDLTIARGLDYYTGTVYETELTDYPEIGSVCSGGRYDNLAEYYTDKQLPGVGISIGLTRLFYVLQEQGLLSDEVLSAPCDVLIIPMTEDYGPAVAAATVLRSSGLRAQLYTEKRKFKAKMSYADKIGVPFIILLGEDEAAQGLLSVKNMESGEQQMLSVEQAVELIRKYIDKRNNAAPIRG